ncbi:MAG TPA: LysM peptidoglycan-binding domain-containing protein, partial [Chloroflexota bacterium]|nr:LysM peptidoglycan-binding domain-containing protein [Chloroflexota bacterium]
MSTSQPLEVRQRSQILTRVRAAIPSRIMGHALVIALSLGVAYAGHTSYLSSQLDLSTLGARSPQPSAFAYNNGALSQDALSSVAVAPAAPADRSQVLRYVAVPGDTVAILADRFDVSESTILWSNSLSAGQELQPGQVLLIPPVSGLLYTVQPGDTVAGIAQRFESDSNSILQFNTIADPSHLATGSLVMVPGGRSDDGSRVDLSDRSGARPDSRAAATATENNPAPAPAPAVVKGPVVDLPRFVPFADRFMSREVGATTGSQPAPAPLKPIVYHVVDGDTLSGIAAKYGISADNLAASNGLLGSADSLAIDQKLLVPPTNGVLHVVVDGDTLETISQYYSAKEDDVARANGLSDPFVLQIGQVLVVPGGQAPAAAAPAPAAQPAPQVNYTVQEGDSVSSIGDTYGLDPQTIINANSIADPYILQPGQQIVIPG